MGCGNRATSRPTPSRKTQPTNMVTSKTEHNTQQMVIVGGFLWRRLGTGHRTASKGNDHERMQVAQNPIGFVSQSFQKRLMLNDKCNGSCNSMKVNFASFRTPVPAFINLPWAIDICCLLSAWLQQRRG